MTASPTARLGRHPSWLQPQFVLPAEKEGLVEAFKARADALGTAGMAVYFTHNPHTAAG